MSTALPEVCTDSRGAGRDCPEATALRCFLSRHQPARKIKISAWPAAFRGALAPAQSRLGLRAGWWREDRLPEPHPLSDDVSMGYPALAGLRAQQWGLWLQPQGGTRHRVGLSSPASQPPDAAQSPETPTQAWHFPFSSLPLTPPKTRNATRYSHHPSAMGMLGPSGRHMLSLSGLCATRLLLPALPRAGAGS